MNNNMNNNMKRIRRRRPIYISLLVLLILIVLYLYLYSRSGAGVSKVVGTILAIVAGVAFWIEYYHNNKIEEASFIMDLNQQFISDVNMTAVEHCLERYYALAKDNKTDELDAYDAELRRMFDIEKPERQYLVNYLVHLEGIATLVNSDVLRLKTINDLMAYRYFIAVNNPVVQDLELKPYKDFYKGCYDIYPDWEKYIGTMPLKDTAPK